MRFPSQTSRRLAFALLLLTAPCVSAAEPDPLPVLPERPISYSADSFHDRAWRDDKVTADLAAFVGHRRASYLYPDGVTAEQVLSALGGPPGTKVFLPGGARLLHACRRHSCPEKAAFVVSGADEAEAAGLIHFNCRYVERPENTRRPPRRRETVCDDQATLTLFLRSDGAWRDALEQWAERETGGKPATEVAPAAR